MSRSPVNLLDAQTAEEVAELAGRLFASSRERRDKRCGRPCRNGQPCRSHIPSEGKACLWHMTDAERETYDAARDAAEALFHRLGDKRRSSDPACWSWPISDADRESVREHGAAGLLWWQAGRCGMCGRDYIIDREIDHDHNTGLVRGGLCMSCNRTEPSGTGPMYDGWRARPAAALFDLKEPYYSPWAGGYQEPRPPIAPLEQHAAYAFSAWLAEDEPTDDVIRLTVTITLNTKSPRWTGRIPRTISRELSAQIQTAFDADTSVLNATALPKSS